MSAESRGLIVHAQRFSLHDGPGIRTTVFFKGCPLHCTWCQNPESVCPKPELMFFADRCEARAECLRVCPQAALQSGDQRIDRERCDGCGICVEACAGGALQQVGREVSPRGLLDEILRDEAFFRSSGGGVTLSGGEATAQMAFMDAFTRLCADAEVPVGLETCGAFRWRAFAPMLPRLAFIWFDLKLMDRAAHRKATGADNRVILANARRLLDRGAPVTFRMPVIPGHNDGEDNLTATAAWLLDADAGPLHLLRYHRMGGLKAARLGVASLDIPAQVADMALERAAAHLSEAGVAVVRPTAA